MATPVAASDEGTLSVGDDARTTRWIRQGPLDGRPLVVLAHGAGAPMASAFMEHVAHELVARGLAVARFDFPYMERARQQGRRRPPDGAPVLLATWRAMLAELRRGRARSGPILIGGKSMGGRIASMLLAEETPEGVAGAVYLGYPLHPAGKPERLRGAHLAAIGVDQLFVQGSRDALCRLDALREVLAPLGQRARLLVVEGGDHSLAVSRKDPFAGAHAWLDAIAAFARERPR